jgi:hypothetical protein
VVAFTARSADGRSITVELSVNERPIAALQVDGRARSFAVPVPPAALVAVKPNVIRVAGERGAAFVLEGFRLLPAGSSARQGDPRPGVARRLG